MARLKDNLEDIELFLKEIEEILETIDSNPSPETELACRLRLVQLQQHIETISNTFLTPQLSHQRKLTS